MKRIKLSNIRLRHINLESKVRINSAAIVSLLYRNAIIIHMERRWNYTAFTATQLPSRNCNRDKTVERRFVEMVIENMCKVYIRG